MAINEFAFTKTRIEELPAPPAGKYVTYHDSKQEGLILIVYPTKKTFHLYKKLKSGKPIKPKIGVYGEIYVEEARSEARKLLARIVQGEDPTAIAEQLAEERKTFGELFSKYIEEHAKVRTTTWQDTEQNIKRYFGDWFEQPLSEIDKKEVQRRMNKLMKAVSVHTANRSLDIVKAVYNWGSKYGYIEGSNPCVGISKFKTESRDRFIKPDEFERFFTALKKTKNFDLRDYVFLSLFTGARQANVLSMRWDEIDFQMGLWKIPKPKSGKSQTVPLTLPAVAVLQKRKNELEKCRDSAWVFPSNGAKGHIVEPKNGWRNLVKQAKLEDLRMHDLRRTLGSYLAMANQSLHVIGKVLGHHSHTSTQIYARFANDPIRQAMEKAQHDMLTAAGLLGSDQFADTITITAVENTEHAIPPATKRHRERKKKSSES